MAVSSSRASTSPARVLPPLPPPRHHTSPAAGFWGIRQPISWWTSAALITCALIGPLACWSLLSYGGFVPSLFLPTPTQVGHAAQIMLIENGYLADIAASLFRVGAGFAIAALLSLPLGIAMGTFRGMESLITPIVGTVRYMPVAAFIPLVILWVGLGEAAKITIIFMGIFFYNVIMIADAVKFIPEEMLNVSYTMGASRKDVLLRVILPAISPNIIDTFRVNIAGAWNYLVISELIAAESGLGYRILKAQRFLKTDEIFVGIITIGTIGLMLDISFKLLSHWLLPWAKYSRS
ncbi:MAG: ABC transporter permease [Cyanobacteria bacterium P01_F01_bin.33]